MSGELRDVRLGCKQTKNKQMSKIRGMVFMLFVLDLWEPRVRPWYWYLDINGWSPYTAQATAQIVICSSLYGKPLNQKISIWQLRFHVNQEQFVLEAESFCCKKAKTFAFLFVFAFESVFVFVFVTQWSRMFAKIISQTAVTVRLCVFIFATS